ncbi:metalloendopeptidase, partial [Nephila pilipes]
MVLYVFSPANTHSEYTMKFLVLLLGLAAIVLAEEEDTELPRLAMQNPDLFGGDMAGIDGPGDAERNAIPGQLYRWPNAQVPYVIDNSLRGYSGLLNQAFQAYASSTCVRFVPRTNQGDYVYIFSGQG